MVLIWYFKMAAPIDQPAIAKNLKLTKREKKIQKKQSRSRHTLMKLDGIETSDCPTRVLCVNNAGLDAGVSKDEVEYLFCCHGDLCDVIMLPRKPYCFVCYKSVDQAEEAYKHLNGYELASTDSRPVMNRLYISYVSKVPESMSPSNKLPPGLIILEDFVTEDYERQLLEAINWQEELPEGQQKELKHRRVKHYGYEFKYGINNVDLDDPLPEGIPPMCDDLLRQVMEKGIIKHRPDQLTVNQYQPGQGIPPHVDTSSAFEDGLMSLSLGSQAVMDFRHPDGHHLSVLLPSRSLLIMTGESRYIWSHGITPRKSDIIPAAGGGLTLVQRGVRTSFTFRKTTGVKHDSKEMGSRSHASSTSPVKENDAASLEEEHVHQVYEKIANHFSGTRHTPWPRIAEFLRAQPIGSLIADIGCGNGKYFGINKGIFEIGSDRSVNLSRICYDRGFQVFVGDILAIPLRSESCDVCLCIAVIHHLSTLERRKKGLSELLRILRPGGKALVYVWAMEQELQKVKSKYLKECKLGQDGTWDTSQQREANTEPSAAGKCAISSHRQADISGEIPEGTRTDSAQDETTCAESKKSVSSLSQSVCDADLNNSDIETRFGFPGNQEETKLDFPGSKDETIFEKSNIETRSDFPGNKKETKIDFPGSIEKTDYPGNENRTKLDYSANINKDQTKEEMCDKCSTGSSILERSLPNLEIHVNRTQFKQQDLLVPWHLKNISTEKKTKSTECEQNSESTFHRYYHVFKQGELEELCLSLPSCKVVQGYYDQGNWAVILEKI